MTPTPEAFSRLELYNVLQSIPDGLTLANTEGRIVFSNHAADQILGKTAATSYVIHDLESPLTTILTLADLILSGEDTREQMEEDVRSMRRAGKRLSSLVMDLLDVHVAEDGALELTRSTITVSRFLEEARDAAVGRVVGRRTGSSSRPTTACVCTATDPCFCASF